MEIIWVFWCIFGMAGGVIACLVSDNHFQKEQKKLEKLKKQKKKLKRQIARLQKVLKNDRDTKGN